MGKHGSLDSSLLTFLSLWLVASSIDIFNGWLLWVGIRLCGRVPAHHMVQIRRDLSLHHAWVAACVVHFSGGWEDSVRNALPNSMSHSWPIGWLCCCYLF